ncbi:AAA family ATPase [Nitrosomonas oligotropha]|uniref:AAA domain-containing protein n=1 Tax=Nitrosomonas oligotropha TaxID=42354 RepID=A0A1H8L5H9_9PROT|nr:AAA family ATPase [Nitrosomonas oligotropha]SDW18544.1 AAA domain-containing protein [Nitrosomonas oligotropha]SEN99928.1 AAA domain-containing protein [Nitrosomonas oligotropha]
MSNGLANFAGLNEVATHLRDVLVSGLPQRNKPNRLIHYVLLFAHNGTGKTRLSMAFKDLGKNDEVRDTLYFNAFTEDLFNWDNDLENDARRVLCLNRDSRFFGGLQELEMENRIGPLLARYADFNFFIDYAEWEITFFRDRDENGDPLPIKVSRGEENIFVWCFFLAVAQLAIDGQETYAWVKYIYVDDPISSLDDNNVIAVAAHLAHLLKDSNGKIKAVISSHHALFFNVVWNALNDRKGNPLQPFFLNSDKGAGSYTLRYTGDTPFFHHVALLKQLHEAVEADRLYTYHFNILRSILEKTATFHGYPNFSACIKQDKDDEDGILHARLINVLSHGNYSLFEPREMLEENKEYFKKILNDFMANYRFNPELFPDIEGGGA